MGSSKNLIKMAVTAKELQEMHPTNTYEVGDFIYSKPAYGTDQAYRVITLEKGVSMDGWCSPYWIPSVDQIKKLLGNNLPRPWESQGTPGGKIFYEPGNYYGHEGLLEEFMFWRFSKTWDSEKWVAMPSKRASC